MKEDAPMGRESY